MIDISCRSVDCVIAGFGLRKVLVTPARQVEIEIALEFVDRRREESLEFRDRVVIRRAFFRGERNQGLVDNTLNRIDYRLRKVMRVASKRTADLVRCPRSTPVGRG